MRTVDDLHIHLNGLLSVLINCPREIPQIVRSVWIDARKGVLRIGRFLDPRSTTFVFFSNKWDIQHTIDKMIQLRIVLIMFLVHALPEESDRESDTLDEFLKYSISFLEKKM